MSFDIHKWQKKILRESLGDSPEEEAKLINQLLDDLWDLKQTYPSEETLQERVTALEHSLNDLYDRQIPDHLKEI